MISSIQLTNFKRHAEFSTQLGAGLTSITGPNGVGKSTLLKGLLYPLFGVDITGAATYLPNRESKGVPSASLHMVLPGYGRCQISRSPKAATVKDAEGKTLASGQTPVNAFIAEAFGVDSKILRMLMYSPQGESAGMLTMGAAALQKKVEEIARVDLVDKVLGLVDIDLTYVNGCLRADTVDVPSDVLQREIEGTQTAIGEAKWASTVAAENLQAAKEEEATLRAELQSLRAVESERAQLRQRLAVAESRVKQCSDQLLEAESNPLAKPVDVTQRVAEISAELERLRALQNDIATSISSIKNGTAILTRKEAEVTSLTAAAEKNKDVEDDLKRMDAELQDALKTQAEKHGELLAAREKRSGLLAAQEQAFCPTCGRPYDESHDPAHLANLLVDAEAEYQAALEKKQTLDSYVSLVQKTVADLKTQIHPNASADLARVREEINTLRQNVEDHQNFLASCGTVPAGAIQQLEKEQQELVWQGRESARLQERVKILRQHLGDAGVELQQAASLWDRLPPEVDILVLEAAHMDLQSVVNQANGEAIQAQYTLNELIKKVDELYTLHQRAVESEKRRQELEARGHLLQRFQKYLRDNRARLTTEVWTSLLSFASHLVSLTTEGRLSDVQRRDGEFFVTEGGYEMPASELSGSQRSIVGLCLRIALTKVFYGGDLPLLLDEISSDMTDETAAATSGMLASLGHQVIVVSHRQGDTAQGEVIAL